MHGGWIATLLDSCVGCAVHVSLPAGKGYTTAELKVNYVRAVTEKYFGRTARLFVFKSTTDADGEDVRNVAAASLRRAAEELLPIGDDGRTTFAVVRVRLTDADAKRLTKRLERLIDDVRAADTRTNSREYGLAAALYDRAPDA